MEDKFVPMLGAEGWQLSNAPVFSMACCKASVDIFSEVGMERLIKKSRKLTNFMEFVFSDISQRYDNCNFDYRAMHSFNTWFELIQITNIVSVTG